MQGSIVPTGTAGALPWCIVMSDTRGVGSSPSDPRPSQAVWHQTVHVNRLYAMKHGYGFVHVQWRTWRPHEDEKEGCFHALRGSRGASWCKIPAIARTLLVGIRDRKCSNIMFLGSDAFVLNTSMGIDEYLERAKRIGDEGLVDDEWEMLVSSNAPFRPWDGMCLDVFWLRATPGACGILRNWWDADFPSKFRAHAFEQEALSIGAHLHNRAYGARVRLLPTAVFFRMVADRTLENGGRSRAGADHPATDASAWPWDPWLLHMSKNVLAPPRTLNLRSPLELLRATRQTLELDPLLSGALSHETVHDRAVEVVRLEANASDAIFAGFGPGRCAHALPRPGVEGFESERWCCGRDRPRLSPLVTQLNGSRTPPGVLRPCWIRDGQEYRWTCWAKDATFPPRLPDSERCNDSLTGSIAAIPRPSHGGTRKGGCADRRLPCSPWAVRFRSVRRWENVPSCAIFDMDPALCGEYRWSNGARPTTLCCACGGGAPFGVAADAATT
jgi:hypothetical protein